MKSYKLFLAVSLLSLTAACQKSEIDQAPAAEVTETSATSSASSTMPIPGATTARVIKEKSSINFVGAKVTGQHTGKFKTFDGGIEYVAGTAQKIDFEIDLSSIETDTEKLTAHLQSPDFFDVAKYPNATFTSTSVTAAPAGSPAGTTHILKGKLNMHGVDREVTVPVNAEVTPEGVRTRSEFTINRQDWAISYKGAVDDLIKDNVLIKLDLLFPPPPVV